jgi:hypothetical protein
MKKIIFTLLMLAAGFISISTYAQYNTGDAQLNASLSKIDADAQLDFGAFKADIGASYNVSTGKIDSWSVDLGMKAGDIYLALELAKITKKPIDEVVNFYQKNKGKGWGLIAKELGIKPGSPEFHALKNNANGKGNSNAHGPKGNPHSKSGKGKH